MHFILLCVTLCYTKKSLGCKHFSHFILISFPLGTFSIFVKIKYMIILLFQRCKSIIFSKMIHMLFYYITSFFNICSIQYTKDWCLPALSHSVLFFRHKTSLRRTPVLTSLQELRTSFSALIHHYLYFYSLVSSSSEWGGLFYCRQHTETPPCRAYRSFFSVWLALPQKCTGSLLEPLGISNISLSFELPVHA